MTPSFWRKQQGLSLREVAVQLGVASAMTVLRYESGAREVPNRVALAYERMTERAVTSEELNAVRVAFLRAHRTAA